MLKRLFAISTGLAIGIGCSGPKPAPPASSTPVQTSAKPLSFVHGDEAARTQVAAADLEFLSFVFDGLPALQATQTLGDWKSSHHDGAVALYAPALVESINDKWCARWTSTKPFDASRTVRLDAYFYLPEIPTPLALPVGISPDQLVDRCRLGLLWAAVEGGDTAHAETLSGAVRDTATSRLGPGVLDGKLFWSGSADWNTRGLWKRGGVSIVTAAVPPYTRPGNQSGSPNTPAQSVAVATGPVSGVVFEFLGATVEDHDSYAERRRRLYGRVDEARRLAAVSGELDAAIQSAEKLVGDADGWSRFPTADERTEILSTIDRWVMGTASLSPARRAAALFVADQLIVLCDLPSWEYEKKPPLARRLEALGANFVWVELDGGYRYTNTWLKEARRLDPDGRAGELAFVTLMESGFDTSGTCSEQHGEDFRAVIREGDAWLQRKPRSAVTLEVHLMVAQAYADIVALANGAGGDYADAEKYRPEVDTARVKALEHYPAAFAASAPSLVLREAWPNAWRLAAGLPPTSARFYCVYD
jgi:hypothetical protein